MLEVVVGGIIAIVGMLIGAGIASINITKKDDNVSK